METAVVLHHLREAAQTSVDTDAQWREGGLDNCLQGHHKKEPEAMAANLSRQIQHQKRKSILTSTCPFPAPSITSLLYRMKKQNSELQLPRLLSKGTTEEAQSNNSTVGNPDMM